MKLAVAKNFRHSRLKTLGGRSRKIGVRAAPVVTMDTTARASSRNEFAYDYVNSKVNPNIGWLGTQPQNIRQRATAATQRDCAWADYGMGFGQGAVNNQWGVIYNGKGCDIICYQSDAIDVWVDGDYIGAFKPFLIKGATAQAGGASTITLAAAGSSATDGYYVGYYVAITSGTGAGQIRKVISYVGSTKVATLESAWTTPPDATSVYNISNNPNGWATEPTGGGTLSYIHLDWAEEGTSRIDVVGAQRGFLVESLGILSPAPARGQLPLMVVLDSFFEGSADPRGTVPKLIDMLGEILGNVQIFNLSGGGTGLTASYAVANRLSIPDRIAPPAEARMILSTMSAGTFTITVNYNGQSSTTGALAYNASVATIIAALNALSVVIAAGGDIGVGGNTAIAPWIFCPHNMPGATLSFDTTGATGGVTDVGPYTGDVDRCMPRDADGNPLPFILLTGVSGNDSGSSDAQVSAAATYVAQQIVARFPTAIPVFLGVFGDAGSGATGVITSQMISRNAQVKTAAQLLPKINGRVPFIDTYENGLGGNGILWGTGTIAAPTAGNTAKYKSIVNAGHPTGFGAYYMAQWLGKRFLDLVQP